MTTSREQGSITGSPHVGFTELIPESDETCPPPPAAVDDYLRNFLLKMDMSRTLDCFQTEWNEMLQKGLLNTELVGVVPDVYTQNHRLDSELTGVCRERDGYRSMASAAADTLTGLQRARDFHRMQHKQLLREKNRLIEDMKALKVQCDRYARTDQGLCEVCTCTGALSQWGPSD